MSFKKRGLFPRRTLINSLQVAMAIREYNNGNPFDKLDLAKALKTTPGSSRYRTLISSSGQFGLTEGSYNAKKIKLTPLGLSIVAPQTDQEKIQGLKSAFFSIPFFKKFFSDYDGGKLPSLEYLENTLNRTYGIPLVDCKTCYKLIVKNAQELGILEEMSGNQYIHLSKLGAAKTTISKKEKPINPIAAIVSQPPTIPSKSIQIQSQTKDDLNLTVNISFELPLTKDVDVYDKIFQSLKKNILDRKSEQD